MAENTRLDRIEAQMKELAAQRALEKKRLRSQEKKDDQRRKFILGGLCMEHAGLNLSFRDKIMALIREGAPDGDKHLWPDLFDHDGREEDREEGREEETHTDNQEGQG